MTRISKRIYLRSKMTPLNINRSIAQEELVGILHNIYQLKIDLFRSPDNTYSYCITPLEGCVYNVPLVLQKLSYLRSIDDESAMEKALYLIMDRVIRIKKGKFNVKSKS